MKYWVCHISKEFRQIDMEQELKLNVFINFVFNIQFKKIV